MTTEHVQLIVMIKLLYSSISILAYSLWLDVCMRFLDECPWDRLRALRGRFVSWREETGTRRESGRERLQSTERMISTGSGICAVQLYADICADHLFFILYTSSPSSDSFSPHQPFIKFEINWIPHSFLFLPYIHFFRMACFSLSPFSFSRLSGCLSADADTRS